MQWQMGEVISVRRETHRAKTITIRLPGWQAHLPGQHYDIRLTAEDGYQAQRSYSVASPPARQGSIDLTVDHIEDGEVSPYLVEGVTVGDPLEVRGPIGGYFVWTPAERQRPLLLVAGGSGVVPLVAMLRHRKTAGLANPAQLVFSVRTPADVLYAQELEGLAREDPRFRLHLTFTRQAPAGWTGYHRRVDEPMLRELLDTFPQPPLCFVCGPTLLVEAAANALLNAGLPPETIRTEHFGGASSG